MNVGRCGEFQVARIAGEASWSYFAAPSTVTGVTFSSAHDRSGFRPCPIICGP